VAAMLETLERHGIPRDYRSQSLSLFLKRSGSTILFRPLDCFDRLRGYNLAWFGIDELTYCKEGAWLVLQQRLRDPKARRLGGFAVWTPKGFDWVYDRFISPAAALEGYQAVLAGARENVVVLRNNPAYYEELKASYDEKFYRQEAEGEYLNIFSGRVYHAYEAEQNDAPVAFNPHKRLNWALDFNIDPMSSVLLQDVGGNLRVLDEISLRAASVNDMCARFVERVQPLVGAWRDQNGDRPLEVGVYGDAAANSSNIQTKKSDYQAIREYFRSVQDIKAHLVREPFQPARQRPHRFPAARVDENADSAHGVAEHPVHATAGRFSEGELEARGRGLRVGQDIGFEAHAYE
jgi:hypothetical protein